MACRAARLPRPSPRSLSRQCRLTRWWIILSYQIGTPALTNLRMSTCRHWASALKAGPWKRGTLPARLIAMAWEMKLLGTALRENVRSARGKIVGVRSDPTLIAITRGEIR